MRTEQRTLFIARDGIEFKTAALCRAHERESAGDALVGLTKAQVEAARTWTDPELAEAFEAFGYELRKARQDAGQFKRRRPNGAPANNPEHNAGPPLSSEADADSAGDSQNRTDSERAMGAG